jgi:hypothetical protein
MRCDTYFSSIILLMIFNRLFLQLSPLIYLPALFNCYERYSTIAFTDSISILHLLNRPAISLAPTWKDVVLKILTDCGLNLAMAVAAACLNDNLIMVSRNHCEILKANDDRE